MAILTIDDAILNNIADAIRGKNGTTETYKPSEMAAAISEITTTGGGSGEIEVPLKNIYFGNLLDTIGTNSNLSEPKRAYLYLEYDTSAYSDSKFYVKLDKIEWDRQWRTGFTTQIYTNPQIQTYTEYYNDELKGTEYNPGTVDGVFIEKYTKKLVLKNIDVMNIYSKSNSTNIKVEIPAGTNTLAIELETEISIYPSYEDNKNNVAIKLSNLVIEKD